MLLEDCFFLGTVVGKYSFKGEVLIKLDTDQPGLYENIASLFIETQTGLAPYFVVKSGLHKSNLLRVTFEDVTDEAGADALLKKKVFLPLDMLPKLTGNQFYFHEIIGFAVIDKQHGDIGKVTGINDIAAQALLEIEHKTSQVLLPIVDEIVLEVDRNNKQLHVQIPEGLLDIYG
jgi:16S rRNA processing protein RimM